MMCAVVVKGTRQSVRCRFYFAYANKAKLMIVMIDHNFPSFALFAESCAITMIYVKL